MVPTPEENIDLLPYFLKICILNDFRPCSLAARHFAQKPAYLRVGEQTRARPGPAMGENKRDSRNGKKRSFPGEKRGDPPPVHQEGGRNGVRGMCPPGLPRFPTRSVTLGVKT
jgi:hypothetical protein